MATPLNEQLQASLGTAYVLERELGGGGMSRVYVAEETAFGRRVVVKLLAPELAATVSVERFKREVQLSARLQHPHIVPVITAGESAGLPYYTMPFVDGESLRERLARQGALPIGDAISILRDVAKALDYAHGRGIVHRDIKPANVLLAGNSAIVADFGIAKALEVSRTEDRGAKLTETGTSIGTLGYMSPEQAAGEPDVDHRADLYSLGCMAYELLAGEPPFAGLTARGMLTAHMAEMPRPVVELRPETPSALADLVMRSLAKSPAERPQSAAEVARELDAVSGPASAAARDSIPEFLVHRRGTLKWALIVYLLVFVLVAFLARAAIFAIGLPDWVFPGALVVMALGLPVILFTAWSHSVARLIAVTSPTAILGGGARSAAQQGMLAKLAARASLYLSWRRTVLGGGYALASLVLLVGVYMGLRALGIGPFGSLLAAGTVGREPLLITEFRVRNADSTLGATISQAVRSSLTQSRAFKLLSQDAMVGALGRMQRPLDSRVDLPLAREIAAREGLRAIVDGEIAGIGSGFLVTMRLISADSGRELASFHEPAEKASDLIGVVDDLSRKLRGRIGESLRDVHASPALSQVTTSSIDALRKYTEGRKAMGALEHGRSVALLREAVDIDSNFAVAWGDLGGAMINARYPRMSIDSAETRAYRLRSRLPEVERLNVTASYFRSYGEGGPGNNRAKAIAALEAMVTRGDYSSTNSLGVELESRREFARAESFARYRVRVDPAFTMTYGYLVVWQLAQGKIVAAESTFALAAARFPGWDRTATGTSRRALLHSARGDIDSAIAVLEHGQAAHAGAQRAEDLDLLASYAMLRGQLRSREQLLREAASLRADPARRSSAVGDTVRAVVEEAWVGAPSARHAQRIDAMVASPAFTTAAPRTRDYLGIARAYAFVGRADRARALLARYASDVEDTAYKRAGQPRVHGVLGEIALAERRPLDAVTEFRLEDVAPDGPSSSCMHCLPAMLARAFDAAGNGDSTIAAIEQYLKTPPAARVMPGVVMMPDRFGTLAFQDFFFLAPFEKRLGELYEARGDHARAIAHFGRFVELWKNADPQLQPQVKAVRRRLAILQART